MKTHKVATLSLRWLEQLGTLSASFEGCANFDMLSFWSFFSPWKLEWMYFLYLLLLIHSSLLAYCSVLSVHGLRLSLDFRVFCYVFGLCFLGLQLRKCNCIVKKQSLHHKKWSFKFSNKDFFIFCGAAIWIKFFTNTFVMKAARQLFRKNCFCDNSILHFSLF